MTRRAKPLSGPPRRPRVPATLEGTRIVMKLGFSGQRKAGEVMKEFYHRELHHGRSGKLVPRNRPDIAKAIAMSEGRKTDLAVSSGLRSRQKTSIRNRQARPSAGQRKTMKHHSPAVDEHAVTELHLYADNTGELYDSKMKAKADLVKKASKSIYDPHKAAKRWLYWVDEAAKRYVKEFGSGSVQNIFSAPVRRAVAKEIEEDMRTDVMREARITVKGKPVTNPESLEFYQRMEKGRKLMATRKHHKKHRTHKASAGTVDSRSLHGGTHKRRSKTPKARSTKAPSLKQLAARKKFAAAARARAKAAHGGAPKKHAKKTKRYAPLSAVRANDRVRSDVHRAERNVKRAEHQLVRSHADKGRALKADITRAVHDLTQAEKELHESLKLIRAHKLSVLGSHKKGHKKGHKKAHHKATAKISVSKAIALARKGK